MNNFSNAITIVVCDSNEKSLCKELNERYSYTDCMRAIPFSDLNKENKSNLSVFVGDAKVIDTGVLSQGEKYIDLSDLKIMHLVDKNKDVHMLRVQMIDGIAAAVSGKTLIGFDLMDLLKVLQDYETMFIGVINSKEASKSNEKVERLVTRAGGDVSKCSSAYLYLEGDISLIEVNDMALSLSETLKEDTYIAFTASYNDALPDEYNVMALFTCGK